MSSAICCTTEVAFLLTLNAVQVTCTVASTTRGGPNDVHIYVGHKGLAAVPAGGLSLIVDTLDASTAAPRTLSAYGATQFTVTGTGFDSVACGNNRVAIGAVACHVTACTETTLVATHPGDYVDCSDGGTSPADAVSSLEATTAAEARDLALTIVDSSGSTLQHETFSGLVSVASGGASVPYCMLADATAAATHGAAANLTFRCSSAAVAAGVVQLHVVPAAKAGLSCAATASGGRRLLEIGPGGRGDSRSGGRSLRIGRRLLDTQPSSVPSVEEEALGAVEPQPIVCKVCSVVHLAHMMSF